MVADPDGRLSGSQPSATRDIVNRLGAEAARPLGSYAIREQLTILYLRRSDLRRSRARARAAVAIAVALSPAQDRAVVSGAHANLATVEGARSELGQERDSLQAGIGVPPESGCLNYQGAVRVVAEGDLDGGSETPATACGDFRSHPGDWFYEYARRSDQLAALHRDPRFQHSFPSRSAA